MPSIEGMLGRGIPRAADNGRSSEPVVGDRL